MEITSIILCVLVLLLVSSWPFFKYLSGKEFFVKRINPERLHKQGDFVFINRTFYLKNFIHEQQFKLEHLQQLRVYTETDWGLSEYDIAELSFPGTKVFIHLGSTENKAFLEGLVIELGLKDVLPFQWDYLPKHGDTSKKDVIYPKELI